MKKKAKFKRVLERDNWTHESTVSKVSNGWQVKCDVTGISNVVPVEPKEELDLHKALHHHCPFRHVDVL